MLHNYRNLKVWQKAVELCVKIYEISKAFPKEELYGITSQIRRSAVSIPSNIAEGSGRKTVNDFSHFLDISLGSCCELSTQLLISCNLNFFKDTEFDELDSEITEIQKMIIGFQKTLTEKSI